MRILTLLTGLSVLLLPALGAAQDFPDRPIRLIVPFPAGGPNDVIARVIGQRMSELLKLAEPVIERMPLVNRLLCAVYVFRANRR